jgi:hypothetical protein
LGLPAEGKLELVLTVELVPTVELVATEQLAATAAEAPVTLVLHGPGLQALHSHWFLDALQLETHQSVDPAVEDLDLAIDGGLELGMMRMWVG